MFVNILLIAVVGLTFPWINKIFYITLCGLTGLLFLACSLRGLIQGSYSCILLLFLLTAPESAYLLAFGSVSLNLSLLFLFICICVYPFSPSSFSSSPRISQALWLLTALSLSLSLTLSSSISHLLSGVSVSARQGVPGVTLGGNELLITSQETRHSTPTPPPSPHPMQHTQKRKRKTTQLSHAQPTKRNSIGETRQQGRGADEKRLEKLLLQALIYNYQTSKIK